MTVAVNKTILLVEDEALIAMVQKQELERIGYSVLTAYSGEKSIEIFRKNTEIDLILMDIDLGKGMDGTDTAEIILDNNDIPVVFLSNHTESAVVEKTEKITSYGYVVKNSGNTILNASIKMAFKLFEANKAIKKQKSLLQSMAVNFPNSFLFLINPDLTISYAAGQEFSKQDLNSYDFIGSNICDLFSLDTDRKSKKTIKSYYYKSFFGKECFFEILSERKYYKCRVIPLISENTEIEQVLSVIENITAEKKLKKFNIN